MPGIWVAVKPTTSTAGSSRYTTLKLWKSRPAAPRIRVRVTIGKVLVASSRRWIGRHRFGSVDFGRSPGRRREYVKACCEPRSDAVAADEETDLCKPNLCAFRVVE